LEADNRGENLIEVLEELGPQLDQRAVLIPSADRSVAQISRHRERLEPWYHTVLPDADTVETLIDKARFYAFAQERDLPIPATRFLRSRDDALAAAETLRFPCIIKPPFKTNAWMKNVKSKAVMTRSAEELIDSFERLSSWTDLLIVQQWIQGGEQNLFSCNAYFDARSKPLAMFVARKIRQWPPDTGTSVLGEEVRNDEVLRQTLRLFESVSFRGLAYLEMKLDSLTGEHLIVEPNVGRATGRSAIAEGGGVDLLYTMYCDVLGLPLPENREQRYTGVKWIYLRQDLQAALRQWLHGTLSLRDWWRSIRGRKVYAVWSWRDPLPFLFDVAQAILKIRRPEGRGYLRDNAAGSRGSGSDRKRSA
jgi:predicted ATP-grasp superfamily ATP-dependent carboligase